jgi:hypothetical protein
MTNMCTCVILLLLRLAANMFMNKHTDHNGNEIEFNKFENRDIPSGGTHVQSTSDSIPTHGELFEVVDHSWCRKMYTVPSLERPPGSRWSRSEEEEASPGWRRRRSEEEEDGERSRRRSPKIWSPAHTRAGVPMQTLDPEACSPKNSVRAEDGTRSIHSTEGSLVREARERREGR